MTFRFKGAALFLAATALPTAAMAGGDLPTLVPHRAVYDLSLVEGSKSDDGASAMSGRMVFEFTGSACEGYTVNFRFVVETTDADYRTTVTDLRTTSFEDGAGKAFDFLSQTYTNQVMTEEVKGSAQRSDASTSVKLVKPQETAVSFDTALIFPTDHLRRIIRAAENGEAVLQKLVFDGSDTGDKLYNTTAIIGPERAGTPDEVEAKIGSLHRWPVSVAYFDAKGAGDLVPEYAISFDLWDNGVSTDLTMDYGEFALAGRMVDYEPLPAEACPAPDGPKTEED